MKALCLPAVLLLLGIVSGASGNNRKHMTEVVVYNSAGKLAPGRRVVLEFTTSPGGVTQSFYTNSKGTAMVRHASTGPVKVFVDGDYTSHRTTGRAPGRIVVRLSAKRGGLQALRRALTDRKYRYDNSRTTRTTLPPSSGRTTSRPSTSRPSKKTRPSISKPSSTRTKATKRSSNPAGTPSDSKSK